MMSDGAGIGAAGAAGSGIPREAGLSEGSERPLVLPFVNLGFVGEFRLLLLSWPILWVAGLEQMVAPLVIGWLVVRYAAGGTTFVVEGPARWALLLALWQLVPAVWVDPEMRLVYLRSTAATWAQAGTLVLFLTTVRTEISWWRIVRGLEILASVCAVAGTVYIVGLWRGEITTLVGGILPSGVREGSVFFSELSMRSLGRGISESGMIRATSLAMYPSSLSMVVLLLIPFMTWRFLTYRDPFRLFVLLGLFLCLVSAQSRIAWVAFLFAALLGAAIQMRWLDRGRLRLLVFPVIVVVGCAAALAVVVALVRSQAVVSAIAGYFTEVRPGSAFVRARIYAETFRMLPEHWIAGWGTSVRIPGMPSNYSAGTHSSFLAMLFQHGVVGLVLYLGLWLSIWRRLVVGVRNTGSTIPREFWLAMIIAMAAFNLREVADNWWSDHLVAVILWTLWGLILTAPRVFAHSAGELPSPERPAARHEGEGEGMRA